MAKVILDADIEAISGKLSKKKTAMYCVNSKTGKCYRAEYNNNRRASNTTAQLAVRATFKAKATATTAWWNTNKPASTTATPTAEWTAMMKAYDAQSKYGNPYAFVRSRVKSDNTVAFVETTTTGGGGSNTGGGGDNAGGGDNQGGGGTQY